MRGDKCPNAKNDHDVVTSIHNRFDIEIINAKTGEISRRAFAENVILNNAWDLICGFFKDVTPEGTYSWNRYIFYGRGSGVPAATDTRLFDQIGFLQSSYHDCAYDPEQHVYSRTQKIVLDETVAVNEDISEVGIGCSNNGVETVLTHAMIKDANGNPIVLHKTDSDIFNIYATVYAHLTLPNGVYIPDTTVYTKNHTDSNLESKNASRSFLDALVGCGLADFENVCFANAEGYAMRENMANKHNCTLSHTSGIKASIISMQRFKVDELNEPFGTQMLIASDYSADASGNELQVPPWLYFYFDEESSWNAAHAIQEVLGVGDGYTKEFRFSFLPYVGPTNAIIKVNNVTVTPSLLSRYPHYDNILCYFKMIEMPFISDSPYPITTVSSSDNKLCRLHLIYTGSDGVVAPTEQTATIFENVIHSSVGIKTINSGELNDIYTSDDMVSWTRHTKSGGTIPISADNQHDRYWKFIPSEDVSSAIDIYADDIELDGELPPIDNVHFSDPIGNGNRVTASYRTPVIIKDTNHVFDFRILLTFGAYVGE